MNQDMLSLIWLCGFFRFRDYLAETNSDGVVNKIRWEIFTATRDGSIQEIFELLNCQENANGVTAESELVKTLINEFVQKQAAIIANTEKMIDAAEVGDWQTVENLIRSGADVDSCFDREYLAIQVAVKNQHLDVVRVLLHNGANPYVIDSDGRFLIEVTEDWITEETIDDNGDVTYKTMRDPKQQEINRLILQTMIETDKESDNYPSDFLLYTAIEKGGCIDLVLKLIDDGANINATNSEGYSVLSTAIINKDWDVVRALLDKGAEVNTEEEATPLMYAAEQKNWELVKELLARGADVLPGGSNFDHAPVPVLSLAANAGKIEIVQTLIERGAALEEKDDIVESGETPLMFACWPCKIEVVQTLIRAGANVNATDNWSVTVLMHAAKRGNLAVVEELVKNGANVNAIVEEFEHWERFGDEKIEDPYYGKSVLVFAIEGGNPEVVEYLLRQGARVNQEDVRPEYYKSAMQAAVKLGDEKIIQSLLEYGESADYIGKDILENAASAGNWDFVHLLLNHDVPITTGLIRIANEQGRTTEAEELSLRFPFHDSIQYSGGCRETIIHRHRLVTSCPYCGNETVYPSHSRTNFGNRHTIFECPECNAEFEVEE